jgi:hypothetical protein
MNARRYSVAFWTITHTANSNCPFWYANRMGSVCGCVACFAPNIVRFSNQQNCFRMCGKGSCPIGFSINLTKKRTTNNGYYISSDLLAATQHIFWPMFHIHNKERDKKVKGKKLISIRTTNGFFGPQRKCLKWRLVALKVSRKHMRYEIKAKWAKLIYYICCVDLEHTKCGHTHTSSFPLTISNNVGQCKMHTKLYVNWITVCDCHVSEGGDKISLKHTSY